MKLLNTKKCTLTKWLRVNLVIPTDTVTWKKDTRSPARVYTRQTMPEGAHGLPWEAEAYQKTKK